VLPDGISQVVEFFGVEPLAGLAGIAINVRGQDLNDDIAFCCCLSHSDLHVFGIETGRVYRHGLLE
jgi:hypothetical protein